MTEPKNDDYPYLLPLADKLTQPWWDALRRHELVIQECADCSMLRHTPSGTCPECGSERFGWRQVSGKGTVYSYVVVHQTALPAWKNSVPYNVVMVDLDDAPSIRLYGNVVGVENDEVKIGMPVRVVFDDVTEEDTLLRWQPDADPR